MPALLRTLPAAIQRVFIDDPAVPERVRQFRLKASRLLLVEQWGLIPPVAIIGQALGNDGVAIAVLGALAAAASTLSWRADPVGLQTRSLLAVGLLLDVLLTIYALSGTGAWQIDGGHMWVFAIWSHCLALLCWRSLLVSGVLGVAHHFVLVYLVPAWVFPADANLWRVALHGAVVAAQLSVLSVFIFLIFRMLDLAEQLERDNRVALGKVEQANRAKSKFLAAASHDLRQPVQSLMLFSSALTTHVAGAEGQRVLGHLDRGLDALKALLDSLLDVSRYDAGMVQPVVEDVPVAELLRQLDAEYGSIVSGKGLAWTVEPCAASVRTDRTLLGRVLRNLIENAIRYTERGGIHLTCRADGPALRIEVRDTGIGIPQEHLETIFEEFHQLGNPARDRQLGLGLGLSIVRRISHLLDHPIEVRSDPGQGSSFSVVVPLGTAPAAPAVTDAPAARAGDDGGFAIVVIDDDAMVLLGLQAILQDWKHRVLVAGSAELAVRRIEEAGFVPDLIVSDYRLGGGRTGTEAIQRLRAHLGRPVPGILLTGETGDECRAEAADQSLVLLHKPVAPPELQNALNSLAAGPAFADRAAREAALP